MEPSITSAFIAVEARVPTKAVKPASADPITVRILSRTFNQEPYRDHNPACDIRLHDRRR